MLAEALEPLSVTISGGTAGGLIAAQVAQLGMEARLLQRVTRLEAREEVADV